MYIGEYERRKKLKLIQQDKDKTGLTKVVVALQDQRSRAPVPSPQQSIMSLGVLTLC